MKKLFSLCLIVLFSSGFFTSCKKNNGDPPELPPQESMLIDFSNFTSQTKSAIGISELKGTNNSNWEFAALVAMKWKYILTTTLAIPVSSFKLAIDQDPVFVDNKTWQWSYSVTPADVTYKARLTGQIGSTDVTWKMYITKEGSSGFAEFLWFEGTSKLDGTGGQWIFNHSSASPEAVLQIDWTKSGTAIGTITYTYLKNDSFKTSYIEYGLTTNTLNAYYTIHYYNDAVFSDVNVEWNTTTKNGRVKCLEYLGDTEWHAWDSNYLNI